MRSTIVTGLLLAVCGLAQEYPKPNGFVNDFANQLPLEAVQSLEKKVRDYQRATGVQIGVAVVPSLKGMSIDEYSQGLFRAWGVGQYGVNNGVLFVWAPTERQIRIHVGRGLESALPKSETDRIIAEVRGLFRSSRYEDGVNAAVDGVIRALGGQTPASANAPPAPPEEPAGRNLLIALGVAAALGVGWWLTVRSSRTARWTEEIPRQLADAEASLQDAGRKRADAQVALTELRREAPEDVWRRFEVMLASTPEALQHHRSDLERVRLMPRTGYAALKAVHRTLRQWQERMQNTVSSLDEVRSTLDAFRARREEAQGMLEALPSQLVRMEAQGVPGAAEGLLRAAGATFGQALEESRRTPANWLLVYDLLADVAACLEQIEYPSRTRYRPVRYWGGDFASPAAAALQMMYVAQMQSSGGGYDAGSSGDGFDSGGGGGGDSGGGFGGGDSGGGGSSSDY